MNKNQQTVPLLTALADYLKREFSSFHIPGHKGGELVDWEVLSLLNRQVFRADLTELPGLDDLHQPQGAIREAQELTADLFGAEESYFLVNGSTCGLEAGILTLCRDGEEIIIPRNVHKSVVYGLILSGAVPRYVPVEFSVKTGLALGPSLAAVEQALTLYPKARGLVLVNPSYQGIAPSLKLLVDKAHRLGIPVLVDEAHGGHFCFNTCLPTPGIRAGADLVVQSAHKLLGSLTQSSFLHVQGSLVERDRLKIFLRMVQTSSPSYLLLASLDGARRKMALHGDALWGETLDLVKEIRKKISCLPGIDLLSQEDLKGTDFYLDPTKLVISARRLGLSGRELAKILREQAGLEAEYADNNHLVLIVTPGNSREELSRLVLALKETATAPSFGGEDLFLSLVLPRGGDVQATPREVYNSPASLISVSKAAGKIAAELVCTYPPGVPLIYPGEKISEEALEYLIWAKKTGASIYGIDQLGRMAVL